jgi:hypothetical protein
MFGSEKIYILKKYNFYHSYSALEPGVCSF